MLGAIISVWATILPPMILLTLISYFYDAFINNLLVANILKSTSAVVGAVILDIVIAMLTNIFKLKAIPQYISLLIAFIFVFIYPINILYLIIMGILMGLIYSLIQTKRGKC